MQWREWLVIMFVVLVVWLQRSIRTRFKHDYDSAMRDWGADPTNAEKRNRALALGRRYSAWNIDSEGNRIVDESAIPDDVHAPLDHADKNTS